MSKTIRTVLALSLALCAVTTAGCDAPESTPEDAVVAGHVQADGATEQELQALALSTALDEAGISIDPSLSLAADQPDPSLACSGWVWRCCTSGSVRCCADLIGDYWCQA